LVFFDNAQTTFRPAIFDASSHSLKISGVEKAAVTSTGLQGAIGATTPSTGAFTTVSASTPIAVASGGTGVTTSTGTTNVVLSNSPTLVTPNLGTPSAAVLTSATGLPISTGVSGLGTGIATALAVNTGSAGAPVLFNGALGTPTSGTVTNLTGTASININGTVGATTRNTIAATTGNFQASGGAPIILTGNSSAQIQLGGTGATDPSIRYDAAGVLGVVTADQSAYAKIRALDFNGTVGATTPSTGAFTTLTGSTSIALTNNQDGLSSIATNNNSVGTSAINGWIGTANGGSGGIVVAGTGYTNVTGAADSLLLFGTNLSGGIKMAFDGTVAATVTSTGLAVTGALSSTNGATFLIDNAAGASPAVLRNSNSANNTTKSSSVLFQGTDTVATVKNIGSIGFFPNDANYVSANLRFLVRSGDADPIERMRIDGSGNVGIGTASPAVKLHLDTATSGLTEILRLNRSTDAADNGVMIAFKQNAFNLAYIGSIREGAAGSDSLVFGTRADWGTGSPSEKMRITSLGNVGINTTSPSGGRLVVAQANSVQPAIHLPTDESTIQGPNADTQIKMGGNLVLQSGNETYVSAKNASGKILFSTGATPTERARIDSSGNLLVGTTSAGGKLVVTQGASSTNAILVDIASSTTKFAEFTFTGSNVGSISYNGTNTVYSTTSDYRLKDITGPLVDSGSFIDALKPKVGTWKSNGSKFVGFLAHEFAEVSPSSVCGEMDAVDSDGKPVHQTMQAGTAEVIANLVAELQSVRARLAVLESS